MVEEGNKAVEIARLCRGGMQAVNHPSCRKLGKLQRQSLRLSTRCGISNPNIADPVEDVLRTRLHEYFMIAVLSKLRLCKENRRRKLSKLCSRFVEKLYQCFRCGTKWIDWKNDSNNKSLFPICREALQVTQMWISMDRWMNASISSDSIIKTVQTRVVQIEQQAEVLSNAGVAPGEP
ncbi:hypothetical protein T08_8579 [Trichinella sp. T8]|nr:hypothetical protein T08_8579 [Trichinella sp. T8]